MPGVHHTTVLLRLRDARSLALQYSRLICLAYSLAWQTYLPGRLTCLANSLAWQTHYSLAWQTLYAQMKYQRGTIVEGAMKRSVPRLNRLASSLVRTPYSSSGGYEFESLVWTESASWRWKYPWGQLFLQGAGKSLNWFLRGMNLQSPYKEGGRGLYLQNAAAVRGLNGT